MHEWIKLDPFEFNRQERRIIHGVAITVGLAPFDVPERVRGFYDDEIGRFVIEFSYQNDEGQSGREAPLASWQSENLTLYVGEHTGCIYEIHLNVDNLQVDAVRLNLQLKKAIDELSTNDRFAARRRHYELANEAISRHATELLAH